jgi:hypothetical protein
MAMTVAGRVPDQVRDMPFERLRDTLKRISDWKAVGIGGSRLRARIAGKGLDGPSIDLLLDIQSTRARSSEKYPEGDRLFFTAEGLRWATPRVAADHCARRLSSATSADVTCGQGGQAISLAGSCDRVVAIEKDPLNVFISSLNFHELGLDDIELIEGDCLDQDMVQKVPAGSPVFSDPARPAGSSERSLGELAPDPRDVMKAYSDRACGFCFEVPPYLSRERIDIPCETEYVSIGGRLNRLNLYTGGLMSSKVSAVVLPAGYSVTGPHGGEAPVIEGWERLEFAAEADQAVVASGLLGAALSGVRSHVLELDDRRTLVLTERPCPAAFLGPSMRVLSRCSEAELPTELRRVGAGKVTLRFQLDPKLYWTRRKELESPLEGDLKVQLFKGEEYLILERLSR